MHLIFTACGTEHETGLALAGNLSSQDRGDANLILFPQIHFFFFFYRDLRADASLPGDSRCGHILFDQVGTKEQPSDGLELTRYGPAGLPSRPRARAATIPLATFAKYSPCSLPFCGGEAQGKTLWLPNPSLTYAKRLQHHAPAGRLQRQARGTHPITGCGGAEKLRKFKLGFI